MAISKKLNERALSDIAPDPKLRPYVFKVGSTGNNCQDRFKAMTENRKLRISEGREYYKEPAYAGVEDWKFLKCWDVETARYDDDVFKGWLKDSPVKDYVELIPVYQMNDFPGIKNGRDFLDLYIMDERYVRSRCPKLPNDPLHDELLVVAAEAIVSMIEDFSTRE